MASINEITVLVVDDNKQMRFLMRSLLRAVGIYRVAEAEGALEAFEIMTRFPIDLVLVDWLMRPVDGIAFTRMVRHSTDSPNPQAKILMLTAHTQKAHVAAARDAGVTGFLKKPICARLLFERMSAALLDTRPYVRTQTYFGPDRRHAEARDYLGPFRRAADRPDATIDIDDEDVRLRA